jgi:hypothetical protein
LQIAASIVPISPYPSVLSILEACCLAKAEAALGSSSNSGGSESAEDRECVTLSEASIIQFGRNLIEASNSK